MYPIPYIVSHILHRTLLYCITYAVAGAPENISESKKTQITVKKKKLNTVVRDSLQRNKDRPTQPCERTQQGTGDEV